MLNNPLALLALSLLALPIIIHALVRFSGRKTIFPSLRFLRQTESRRLRLIEIKRWPLLILRLLAIALLVFALSGPTLMKENRSRAVLVLIDSSLSMNTAKTKEQAAGRAREAISSIAPEDVAAVAQFDESMKLLSDFTSDRVALENAVASYSPRYGAADFGAALTWANKLLAAQPRSRELIFISDLQASNLHALEPIQLSGVDLKVVRVNNERRTNARIDSISVRAAGEALEVDSTALFDDGERTRIEPINLKFSRSNAAGNSASDARFSAKMIGDDLLAGAVRTNMADDFDPDDTRFFVARVAGAEQMMIVQPRLALTDQAPFIEKALQATSSAAVARRQDRLPDNADGFESIHTIIAPVEALSKNNIVAAREHVRKGGSLVLTAGAETRASTAMERLKELDEHFTSLALDQIAPNDVLGLMQPVRLVDDAPLFDGTVPAFASVRFQAANAVHQSEGETLLRYSNGEPAAVKVRAGAGLILLFGFGLSDKDSSLVLNPLFPEFIEWITESAESNQRKANLIIGVSPIPRGLTELTRIYSGNNQAQDEPISDHQNALEEPGVYKAEYSSGKIVFALNAPVAESSLAQSSEQEFLKRVTFDKVATAGTESNRKKTDLWMIIAICALAASLVELVYSEFKRAR
jgi:hypothetical protein